ncbi:hypothetical protein HPF_09705 [Hydrogenophaga pseudoflava]|uniref:Uncharacterized protein n=1 Tax=Hydrogenophaga pseudoflava TaxID=47421 RepID=A0A4P6WWP4_HYDPS|nr:hypothetical protein HPF_09705 [Hydrogenophaga pseudoflava]
MDKSKPKKGQTSKRGNECPGYDLSGFPGRTLGARLGALARVLRGEATATPEALHAARGWVVAVRGLIGESGSDSTSAGFLK